MPKMQVAKSIDIAADPQQVFEVVSDFDTWTTWSPWLCAEPTAEVIVSDDSNSVGSTYNWKGELTGEGQVTHANLQPGKLVEMDLEFVKPWKSQAKTTFQLEPVDSGTGVTWTMDSSLPWFLFWMKGMTETMIGMDYDRGLSMVKDLVETGKIDSRTDIKGVASIGPLYVAGIRGTCHLKEIGDSMDRSLAEAREKLPTAGISTEGEVCAVYHDFRMKEQIFDYTIGFVLESPATPSPGISVWNLPATKAVRVDHWGCYGHLGNSWSAAYQYARYNKLKQSKVGTFELCKTHPSQVAPQDVLTEIYLPLK